MEYVDVLKEAWRCLIDRGGDSRPCHVRLMCDRASVAPNRRLQEFEVRTEQPTL
jgi:hypothetical protein